MPFTPVYEVPEARRAYTIEGKNQPKNGRIGVLMLHGFMGSPTSSHEMAEYLAEHGITVHCPLLPGHGHLPYQIKGFSKWDWIREAEEGLRTLRGMADRIFLMGHSMGAVLCAHLAIKTPDICGLVMLAPLYEVPDPRIKLALFGRYFMPWFYPLKRNSKDEIFLGRVLDYDPTINVHDPNLQEWLVQASRIPVDGAAEMVKMAALGRKLWGRLQLPSIIFQGQKDPAVNPGNSEKIYQALASQDKEIVKFPQAGHELMRSRDPIHVEVWQGVHQFIAKR